MEEIHTLIPARYHSKDEEQLQKTRASLIGRHLDMQGFMFYEKNCSLMIHYDPRKVSYENLRQVAVIADVLKNHPEHDITAIEADISARLQKEPDDDIDRHNQLVMAAWKVLAEELGADSVTPVMAGRIVDAVMEVAKRQAENDLAATKSKGPGF